MPCSFYCLVMLGVESSLVPMAAGEIEISVKTYVLGHLGVCSFLSVWGCWESLLVSGLGKSTLQTEAVIEHEFLTPSAQFINFLDHDT